MERSHNIIVYGQDATLLNTRAWLLRAAGFDVSATTDFSEIEKPDGLSSVGLLILCHTLSRSQVSEAIELAQSSEGKIEQILFVAGRTTGFHVSPIPTVDPLTGPTVFIDCVKEMLSGAPLE